MTKTELKEAGLKVTLPRLRVIEILERSETHHMSAENIYKILLNNNESIGLATVYRVLTQFESAGIVDKHNFDEQHSVYELANHEHHDHMIDLDTGKIVEFVDEDIEILQKKIAERHGYALIDHEMVLYVRKKVS
ncbi:MAG: ferric iron uptake transcriptional regulator [Pseudomonadales bacterium]|nr:ferric iron uptake transcriptional regulator [Pseudomonadales bacterium]